MSPVDLKSRNDSDTDDDSSPSGGLSSGQIQDLEDWYGMESNKKNTDSDSPEDKEKDKLGDDDNEFDYDDDDRGGIRISGRKLAAVGATAGIGIGAIFGMSSFSSGPLQFIHLAKMQNNFHFFEQNETDSSRTGKMIKWAHYRGTPEKLRLGAFGNYYTDKIETKLKAKGIEPSYNAKGAYLEHFEITDSAKYAEAHNIENEKNALNEHLREKYGSRVSETNGKFKIEIEGGLKNARADKTTIRTVATEIGGDGRIIASARGRIMGDRGGINLSPLNAVTRKENELLSDFYKNIRDKFKKDITDGVDNKGVKTSQNTENDDKGNPKDKDASERAKAATDEIDQVGKSATESVDAGSKAAGSASAAEVKSSAFKESLGKAGKGIAVVGIACLVRGIAKNVDAVKHTHIVVPLMRVGMQFVAIGNQIMSGNIKFEDLGAFNQMLNDPETKSSWAEAKSIQAELGKPANGPDMPEEAKIKKDGNWITSIGNTLDAIPGIDSVCSVAENPVVQTGFTAIQIATGGGIVATAVQETVSRLFLPGAIEKLVGWLAGNPIDIAQKGGILGNYINFGVRLSAGYAGITGGGSELTPGQALEWNQYRIAVQKEELSRMSVAGRLFNIYDYRSLASNVIDNTNTDVSSNVAQILANPLGIFSSISNMGRSIFMPKASAATAYDYGFPTYGFSMQDLDNKDVENPLENAKNVNDLLSGSDGQKYKDKAKACFGTEFDSDNNPQGKGTLEPFTEIAKHGCNDNDATWKKVKMYVHDSQVAESMMCYHGDEKSCSNIGFASASSSVSSSDSATPAPSSGSGEIVTSGDTSNIPCAAGTDKGVADGYTGGNLVKIKLCDVQGIDVNSQVSGKVDQMLTAAKSAGVTLTGSGFRVMSEQERLYNCYITKSCNNGNLAAKPGFSNHQMGLAIDFKNCSAGGPAFTWLSANAATYGFKNLPSENWHWSVTGN